MRKTFIVAAAFSWWAVAQELPPGHPPLSSGQPSRPAPALPQEPLPTRSELPPGHPPPSGKAAAPPMEELLKMLEADGLKGKEKPFEIAVTIGRLFYSSGRFAEAAEYFTQAVAKAEPARAFYAAQLKRAQGKKVPAPIEVGCAPTADSTVEALLAAAQEKAKSDAAAAAACARAALYPLREVEVLLANSKLIQGDAIGALAVFERQLALFDSNTDALFGRALLLLDTRPNDMKALRLAKAELERLMKEYPTSPRAAEAKKYAEHLDALIAAGGASAFNQKRRRELVLAAGDGGLPMARAPLEPAAASPASNQTLEEAEALLAKRDYQAALDKYKAVMVVDSQNPRVQAGMAWTTLRLNRPMAPRVWEVALATDPGAIDRLADTLRAKGDDEGARELWKRLKQSAPAWADRVDAKLSAGP